MRRHCRASAAAFCMLAYASPAKAWIFHEHTGIGRTGVASLPEDDRATLAGAWAELRAASPRLCAAFAEPDSQHVLGPGREPPETGLCFDFPMLPAIAADFSCAPFELWKGVVEADWVPEIARAAHHTEVRILEANQGRDPAANAEAVNQAWHDNHFKNFQFDPGYLRRASGNVAHFSWPRRGDDLDAYLAEALAPGRAPNAAAFYTAYHVAAVRFANRARKAETPRGSRERREALRWMFVAEATALHYLEDSFSAGHAVGRAGDTRDRTGTHDYYCEHGVEGRIWPAGHAGAAGEPYVAHGDAFMALEDRRHAAAAVRLSLRDVAEVLAGSSMDSPEDRAILTSPAFAPAEDMEGSTMNACAQSSAGRAALDAVPGWLAAAAQDPWIWSVLRLTIMPALATDHDREPHTTAPLFPTEVGPFVGAFAAGRFSSELGLGGIYPQVARFPFAAEGGVEVGFGGAGMATSSSDAMLLLSAGAVLQSGELDAPLLGHVVVPARIGFSVRLRAPFRYVPVVELLYTLPAVLLGSDAARGWIVAATEAGFFGLERQWNTPVGSFQIVALREVSFRYLTLSDGTGAAAGLEFPVLEMKPRPWYGASTGNSFALQLGVATDLGPSTMSLGAFLRVGFDTRRYLSL